MKRYNLLLVSKETGLRPAILKALSKSHKSNFIFELPTLEEAADVLSKLHIDLLLLDLDNAATDLVKLSARHPNLQVIGIAAQPSRVQVNLDPMLHRVLEKRDLQVALQAELKSQRQGPDREEGRKPLPAPAASGDFRDFSQLTSATEMG